MAQYLLDKIQKLQSRAARVITEASYDTRSSYALDMLGWKRLSSTRAYDKSLIIHKALNNLVPDYMCNMFQYRNYKYSFRDSENRLALPKPRRGGGGLLPYGLGGGVPLG